MKYLKWLVILTLTLFISIALSSCSEDTDAGEAITGIAEAPDGTPVAGARLALTYDIELTPASGASVLIEFSVEETQHIVVEVFDSNNDIQATLIDREMASGIHNVTWIGNDSEGTTFPNGIYLAQITYEDGEVESFYIFLNRSDFSGVTYDSIIPIFTTDQDGRFVILKDDLPHHDPNIEEFGFTPGPGITLRAFDQNHGISPEILITYSEDRSSPERVTLMFSD